MERKFKLVSQRNQHDRPCTTRYYSEINARADANRLFIQGYYYIALYNGKHLVKEVKKGK